MLVYMPLPEDLQIKTGNCRRPEGREQLQIECQTAVLLKLHAHYTFQGTSQGLYYVRPQSTTALFSTHPSPPKHPSFSGFFESQASSISQQPPPPKASREKKKIPIALLCKANCPSLVFNLSLLG